MITMNSQRARQDAVSSEMRARRFGPWPWYLSVADLLGLDVELVDDIAGDLAEVCADRGTSQRFLRRAWCVGQVLRAVPHLVLSTLRRGRPRARRRVMGTLSILLAAAASIVAAIQLHVGPPAMITGDRGFDANRIIINYVSRVQLPIRALDARGHTVSNAAIRYEPLSDDAITVSADGAAQCHAKGDAVVRASVNEITSLVTVHCRPVAKVYALPTRFDFIAGDQPQAVQVQAVDAHTMLVGELRGAVGVVDTTVATLRHGLLAPRAGGATHLSVSIGDAQASVTIVVHEIVKRFDNLSAKQHYVAMPLRLARNDTLHFGVPAGTYWVKWMRRDNMTTHPAITAEGPGYCHMDSEAFIRWLPSNEYGAFCYFSEGARVRLARSTDGAATMDGALLLEKLPR